LETVLRQDKKILEDGKIGGNQHTLSKDCKGEWAMDLGGSSGCGGNKIDDDKITIQDITDYH